MAFDYYSGSDTPLPSTSGTSQQSKTRKMIGAGLSGAADADVPQADLNWGIRSFKKGGKVRKTGLAKVHKGERVLTKGQARTYKKSRMSK